MIKLVPKSRTKTLVEPTSRQLLARAPEGALRSAQSARALVRNAVEPLGSGPYVEAIREWIERVTPRPQQRSVLRLLH